MLTGENIYDKDKINAPIISKIVLDIKSRRTKYKRRYLLSKTSSFSGELMASLTYHKD